VNGQLIEDFDHPCMWNLFYQLFYSGGSGTHFSLARVLREYYAMFNTTAKVPFVDFIPKEAIFFCAALVCLLVIYQNVVILMFVIAQELLHG